VRLPDQSLLLAADSDHGRLDPSSNLFWLHAIRTRSMHKCSVQHMKLFLKSRKLKYSGSRSALIQQIESLFTGSHAPPSLPSDVSMRNLELLPRDAVINGFLGGIVSSAEQLQLSDDERREVFMSALFNAFCTAALALAHVPPTAVPSHFALVYYAITSSLVWTWAYRALT
jgi:hypothetical protein